MVEHSAVNCMAEHHKPLFWRRLANELSPLVVLLHLWPKASGLEREELLRSWFCSLFSFFPPRNPQPLIPAFGRQSASHHFHLRTVPRSGSDPRIAGQQWSIEHFGKRDVSSVVGR